MEKEEVMEKTGIEKIRCFNPVFMPVGWWYCGG